MHVAVIIVGGQSNSQLSEQGFRQCRKPSRDDYQIITHITPTDK